MNKPSETPAIATLQENEAIIEKGLNTFYEVGNALTEIRDNKLYKESYSTFEQYCIERWDIKKAHVYQLIQSAKTVDNLSTIVDVLPETQGQTRELSKAPPEEQAQVWQQAQEETGKEQPTAKEINNVVQLGTAYAPEPESEDIQNLPPQPEEPLPQEPQKNVHVSNNSGNNEWYTPERFIESARLVMGAIELDPASSEVANKTVKAGKFYTAEDDGLTKEWAGKLWLNPPYAQPLIKNFSDKLCESIESGNVNQAIVLVNNATETAWFQNMLKKCAAVCFTSKRVKFIDVEGNDSGAPLQGQALLYFGGSTSVFAEEFSKHGEVLKK